jgi:hypothetical protein
VPSASFTCGRRHSVSAVWLCIATADTARPRTRPCQQADDAVIPLRRALNTVDAPLRHSGRVDTCLERCLLPSSSPVPGVLCRSAPPANRSLCPFSQQRFRRHSGRYPCKDSTRVPCRGALSGATPNRCQGKDIAWMTAIKSLTTFSLPEYMPHRECTYRFRQSNLCSWHTGSAPTHRSYHLLSGPELQCAEEAKPKTRSAAEAPRRYTQQTRQSTALGIITMRGPDGRKNFLRKFPRVQKFICVLVDLHNTALLYAYRHGMDGSS